MTGHRTLRFRLLREGEVPTVESDFHIPLKLAWVPPELRPEPAYVRVSGTAGAELEFRVNPESGVVLALVVLRLGAVVGDAASPTGGQTTEPGCSLVVEPAVWERERSGAVFVDLPIRAHWLPDGIQLEVEGPAAADVVHCGPLTFGVDADGSLAFLNAQVQIADRHFQS